MQKANMSFSIEVDVLKYSEIGKHHQTINNRYIKTDAGYISKDQIIEGAILELNK